ncbi:phage tail fiber domain-containing protein [Stenotrophomonas pavanii]|uniref:phage tail fiber domain-containing protein n=1 Tax=Stenotrophomonas pavanii TaxID=487698 RepID=UPI0040421A4C
MQEQARGLSFVRFEIEPGDALRLNVPFPFIDRDHVRALVGEEDAERQVAVTWLDATTVELPSQAGILDGHFVVLLRRFTPITAPLISYKDGANLPARDLNKSVRQLLYALQEAAEFGSGGNGGNGGGPGSGSPDINVIIDGVLRSPALQDLLTRIELIDMNAEAVLEEILRSHEFFEVQRDYGDKITGAYHEIGVISEGNKQTARELLDLFARVDSGERSNQAQFLRVNEAIADESAARVRALTELQGQIVENGEVVAAALNQRIDDVVATTEEARASTEQRLGAEIAESAAQVRTEVLAEVDKTSARVSDLETAVVKHGDNIAGLTESTEALADAEGANTAFRQQMASSYGANVPQGIGNLIDGEVASVAAAFEQRVNTEATAREALASQVSTLQTTTAPTIFSATQPTPPAGGFKVPTFWVKAGQTGAYLTHVWDGTSWRKADLDVTSPTGALVQQLQSTKIDASQAQAIASTQVQAFKDGSFAALQQNFSVVAGEHAGMYGQWQANYSVKINAGTLNGQPVVAGIALSANPATGSDFVVMVDRFAVVHPQYTTGGSLASVKFPFVVGTVGGQATVGIQGALVVDGTITADKLRVNSLSAITANAGTINGGTFKTHTLDANGNVTNALEFRAEMSNLGEWPLWIGSGGKTANNAVMWVDRYGNAKFAGKVNAPNIVGQFQSATGISWGGATSLCYRSGNNYLATGDWVQIHSWTLGAPVLSGEGHTPSVSVTVTANRLIYGLHVIVEELRDSVWAVIASYEPPLYHSLISVSDGAGNSFTHADYYTYDKTVTLSASGSWTGGARQFRLRARATPGYPQVHAYDAASYPDFQIVGVSGFTFGIR